MYESAKLNDTKLTKKTVFKLLSEIMELNKSKDKEKIETLAKESNIKLST